MPTKYCGRTNNYSQNVPRASMLKKPEPPKFKTVFQLTDELMKTPLGSVQAREILQELMRR